MKVLLIFFLIFSSFIVHCQHNHSYCIEIDAHASINRMKLNIMIERYDENIKVFYNKLDSIDPQSSESDSKRIQLHKKYAKAKSNSKKERIINRLKTLSEKYEIYKKDTLIINVSENIQYSNLLDTIYKTDKNVLIRDRRRGSLIILDGTSFKIRVLENNKVLKDLYIHAPRSDSHPLIYKLISETLDIYRINNENSFLDKKYTNGY